jgi:SAM-dependent methyltransferase
MGDADHALISCDVLFQRLDGKGSGEVLVSEWRKAVEQEPDVWEAVKSRAEWEKVWLQLNPLGSVDFAQFMSHILQANELEFQVKTVEAFYDQLSMHLVYKYDSWPDYTRAIGNMLHRLILERLALGQVNFGGRKAGSAYRVLDAFAGVGTYSIGLAERGKPNVKRDGTSKEFVGYEVTSMSCSKICLDVLASQREAHFPEVQLNLLHKSVMEIQSLEKTGAFDVVLCLDNCIANCLNRKSVDLFFANLSCRLKGGGLLLLGVRDYDEIIASPPRLRGRAPVSYGDKISFELFTWDKDNKKELYTLETFLMEGTSTIDTKYLRLRQRAALREEIERDLADVGFGEIFWLPPEKTGLDTWLCGAFKKEKGAHLDTKHRVPFNTCELGDYTLHGIDGKPLRDINTAETSTIRAGL